MSETVAFLTLFVDSTDASLLRRTDFWSVYSSDVSGDSPTYVR